MTGGSRGIGRATVSRLADDGAHVVFTYHQRRDEADSLVSEVAADGGSAVAVQLDVADTDAFPDFFGRVDGLLSEAGADGLDVVVLNAGIFASSPIAETTAELWDRVMNVNARGAMLTLTHAIPRLSPDARVIALSTIGTSWPRPGEAAYAASKAAVEQLIRVASRELGDRGITANVVAAGPTDTDLLHEHTGPEAREGTASMTALGRLGTVDDIAGLVALLARPESGWVTGQIIRADGGLA